MNLVITLLPLLIPLVQTIAHAWGSSTGNSLGQVAKALEGASPDLTKELASIGAALFPHLAPNLHAAAVALLAAESHTGAASWTQAALNVAEAAGVVQFGPQLRVDGIWGPKSTAALKAFQAALHIPVTGMFADAEIHALSAILAKA